MRRLAFLLAVGAVLALPAVAFADSYIEVWESPNDNGDKATWWETFGDRPNLASAIAPFSGTSKTCAGAYSPFEEGNWMDCVSSFRLDLRSGDCLAVYNKINYTERLDLFDAHAGSRIIHYYGLGADDDKWASVRWGHWSYTNLVCVW